jgi:hypothetical protein
MSDQELNSFAENLLQEVIAASESEENGEFRINAFTQLAADYLIEAEEIDDITVCYHKSRGAQINGYSVSQDEDYLDLFITIFNQQSSPPNVTKTQVESAFRQADGVLRKALAGHHKSMESATAEYDMFERIHQLRDELSRARIYLLTDGIVNSENFTAESGGDISVTFHVWDIRRIFRFASSGRKVEPIEINFEQDFGATIPCLSMVDPDSDYQGYLAVIPGDVLAGVYEKYGPRLLERNVRSFLQARGNVNKGIRKTIMEEPHRFFAYNNGISATADHIEFADGSNGRSSIRSMRNLQIVNGGQTTASLYHTSKKDKASLKGIYVQAKLSVIPPEQIDGIVPLISRYANSQNKVSDADFSANDPFHVRIEELSRTVWAPAADGTNKQTRWFYERARGQYLDAKSREGTPARKRQFETTYPNAQKFTKTDLSKYEHTWMQLPHLVSLGAQKNFNHFSVRLKERGRLEVDQEYFEHLVAKAILFKTADKIFLPLNYGSYKAFMVTYTLAWLSHNTSQRIDLKRIWLEQKLSPILRDTILEVSIKIHKTIIDSAAGRNVTEWTKRKECWETVCKEEIGLSAAFQQELMKIGRGEKSSPDKGIEGPDAQDLELIAAVSSVQGQTWFGISKWAKETNNLQSWQRSIAFSIGRALSQGNPISRKQAVQGQKILDEVKALGFNLQQ